MLERAATKPAGLLRMNKACTSLQVLLPGLAASALKITQDDQVWIAENLPSRILKYDLIKKTVVSTYLVVPPGHGLRGIEVYGSRRIVCNGTGKPGTSVKVNVQSRKAGDGGKSYALACSPGRRPGIKFANGEWLNLDATDPLFYTSALGLAPTVFQNFKGVLDAKGNAPAQVNIPSTLPPNLGITIFVAGVIYDKTGVLTVTNTHWFVLN